MDDEVIFSIHLLFNKITWTCAQQEQQWEKQDSL
jgi:hypothetical protein